MSKKSEIEKLYNKERKKALNRKNAWKNKGVIVPELPKIPKVKTTGSIRKVSQYNPLKGATFVTPEGKLLKGEKKIRQYFKKQATEKAKKTRKANQLSKNKPPEPLQDYSGGGDAGESETPPVEEVLKQIMLNFLAYYVGSDAYTDLYNLCQDIINKMSPNDAFYILKGLFLSEIESMDARSYNTLFYNMDYNKEHYYHYNVNELPSTGKEIKDSIKSDGEDLNFFDNIENLQEFY
jgi:hypothetical protein